MFYMPGTRMLFGDARVTTEGEFPFSSPWRLMGVYADNLPLAIKAAIETRVK